MLTIRASYRPRTMTRSETAYCALCWVENGVRTPANVKSPGMPICREQFAESHARALGIAPYPVDVTLAAPALLQ
jgi:hypothetical protein